MSNQSQHHVRRSSTERTWDVVHWRDEAEELEKREDEIARVSRHSQNARVEELVLHGLCVRIALSKERECKYSEHEAEEANNAGGPRNAEAVDDTLYEGRQHDSADPAS